MIFWGCENNYGYDEGGLCFYGHNRVLFGHNHVLYGHNHVLYGHNRVLSGHNRVPLTRGLCFHGGLLGYCDNHYV